VLVDRLGIITEQAPPYCPSAKGTVEALFRWMTQRFERRLPNTSHGIHDAQAASQAGAMTLEELERYFFRAIVDDYQQSWDGLRRQTRAVLWEEAVRQTGVPQSSSRAGRSQVAFNEGGQPKNAQPLLPGP
jgi:hypothetical protein